MAKNYGLPPAVESECPKCKSYLQIWQRWVEKPAKEPPPCPHCREHFLTLDDGKRVNSITHQEYTQSNVIEYTLIKMLRRGPAKPESVEPQEE